MDNRTLIAIILCLIFYLAYSYYLNVKYPSQHSSVVQEKSDNTETNLSSHNDFNTKKLDLQKQSSALDSEHISENNITDVKQDKVILLSSQDLVLENDLVVYQFEQNFASINSIKLKNYKDNIKDKYKVIDFVDNTMLAIQGFANLNLQHDIMPVKGFYAERKNNKLVFWKQTDKWKIAQEFSLSKFGYGMDINVIFENLSDKEQDLDATLVLFQNFHIIKSGFSLIPRRISQNNYITLYKDKSLKTYDLKKYCESSDNTPIFSGQGVDLGFIGIDKHYFLGALSPKTSKFNFIVNKKQVFVDDKICSLRMILTQPQGYIKPKEKVSLNFIGYWGPKEEGFLTAVNDKFKNSIDLGWFGFIGVPLLIAIKGFYKVTNNYGLAIIILTLCLKLLFYPLTKAAAISAKRMQKLQPELNKIKDKYKDDKALQQKELMAFMAKNKINPMKGCLPILPQIPVFIAFYNVLSHAIELRHASFFMWIKDLSSADPYFILPIMLGLGMFVQQKITPNPGLDKTQEKILLMMPIIFTVMMLSLPSGLVIYMLTNILLSIVQQYWLNKTLVV